MPPSGFHHVEIWVADLALVEASWKWLFGELGWEPYQNWPEGRSWRAGDSYLVVEQSSAVRPGLPYDRMRPGLNHLALHAPDRAAVDRIHSAGPLHGWRRLFASAYPHAGGSGHYAAYLVDVAGFEVEVVAPVES
jgi:catechol 2,3-dioxygenase-like lactoylglutathione lyase family enzyme